MASQCQSASAPVDGKERDAVVPPIRRVKKPASGMHENLSGRVISRERVRKGRDGLERFQKPAPGVVGEDRDARSQFIDGIGEFLVRSERDVPRTSARLKFCRRGLVRNQRTVARVKPVNQ